MAGRGSFIESFPLFGFDLADYDDLFAEKLDLLLRLRAEEHVTWSGRFRAPLEGQGVYPRPFQEQLPIWVAAAAIRARPCALARLACPWRSRSSAACPSASHRSPTCTAKPGARGHDPALLKLSINAHGLIADTSQHASDIAFPPFATMMNRIGQERGWPPMSRADFEASRTLRGANVVGSAQEAIDKILFQYEIFHHDRFLLQFTVGSLPHADVMRSIELYGTEVAPAVRRETLRLQKRSPPA